MNCPETSKNTGNSSKETEVTTVGIGKRPWLSELDCGGGDSIRTASWGNPCEPQEDNGTDEQRQSQETLRQQRRSSRFCNL